MTRPLCVVAAGVGLALLLGWAGFAAWFTAPDMLGRGWENREAVAASWHFVACVVVVVLHLLWMLTWCLWRGAGWSRFVAAAALLPGFLYLAAVSVGWVQKMSTNECCHWARGEDLVEHPMGPLVEWQFLIIVVPAVLVAFAVLVLAWTPSRGTADGHEGRGPTHGIVRAAASGVAFLGGLVLAGWLVTMVLAVWGFI